MLALPGMSFALSPEKSIEQYVLNDWNNIDGLPQNTVTSIAQTADGYLWLGTLEGLVRFDGKQFTLLNTRTHPAFTHNFVVSLLTDRLDRLWIATSGGGLLLMRKGHYTLFGPEHGLPSAQVSTVFEDIRGKIWIGTDGGGLARLNENSMRFDTPFTDLGSSVRTIAESKSGLWVGTESGLSLISREGQVRRFTTEQGLSHNSIRALLPARSGVLWVSNDLGVDVMELGKFTGIDYQANRGDDVVVAMHQDRDGNVWLGSDGGGLLRWKNNELSSFTTAQGLSDNSVLALFESNDGSLWVGTNLGGVNRLKDGRITTITSAEGLANDFVRAVYEDSKGALWIGTQGGGLMHYQHGKYRYFTTADGLPDDTIFAITEDASGALWVGTDYGLARLQGDSFITAEAPGLSDDTVLALLSASDGTLWVGTYAGGLNNLSEGKFTALTTEDGLANNTINTLFEDSQGQLWIGTRGGGLSRLKDGEIRTFNTENGLSDDLVFALHEDSDGSLWIGTYGGGIIRMKNGRFTAITEQQGLFDNVVHRILEDDAGRFWMSSNRGIFSASIADLNAVADGERASLHSTVFGQADGMKNVECNGGANAGLISQDGSLWFPSVAGVVQVSPVPLNTEVTDKPVLIEKILLNGIPQPIGELNLAAGVRNLEVDFTVTDLANAENLRFRYRADGLDHDWVISGKRRTAYYSELPAGNYQFEVQADYGDGSWPLAATPIAISVLPFYYETRNFRATIALAIALLFYLLYRLRVRQLTGRNQRLEAVVSDRTAELEAANKQLSQLASEDGLTGLLNRRAFDDTLLDECRRAERTRLPLALLLLDIDYFKQFNDIYGHQAGDECLQEIARTLIRACGRAGESVARYGGEELAIILPGTTAEKAIIHGETLRELIKDLAIPHSGSETNECITTSVGVTCITPTSDVTPGDLLAAADKALYQAKNGGRDCVEFCLDYPESTNGQFVDA